jgi:hypothetical protein
MGHADVTLSGDALAHLVEFAEAEAYADLLHAAPPEWRSVAEQTPAGWLLLAPALDILLFNRLIGTGIGAPATQGDLAEAIARFRGAGVRNFGVQLSPAAQPESVADWLAGAGLAPRDRWTKVFRPADPVAPARTELRIEPVQPGQAQTFAAVTTAGFGMPPQLRPWIASTVGRDGWHHYLAWSGADAVAAAALFIRRDVGWLGVASTLPEARRRGAQGALMARRIEDGIALGCRWFVTETGEDLPERPNPSFRNMVRAGFKVAYHRTNVLPSVG